jgi:hypothetical protein
VKLYVYETLLQRLAPDLQDMAAALGPFIQEAHAMVGQRPLARHRHVAAADQSCIREGLVGGAIRAGRDQQGAPRKLPKAWSCRMPTTATFLRVSSAMWLIGRVWPLQGG